jgi:hypothetical protein
MIEQVQHYVTGIKITRRGVAKLLLGLCLAWIISVDIFANSNLYGPYKAKAVEVINGDNIKMAIDLWPGLTKTVNLSLVGIYTPSISGKINGLPVTAHEKVAAEAAKVFVHTWLAGNDTVTVYDLHEDQSAGQVIGKVKKDGFDLIEDLLEAEFAKKYNNGKKQHWFEPDNSG